LNYIRLTRRFTLRCVPSYPTLDLRMTLRTFGATCVRVAQVHAMEGSPGRRLSAPIRAWVAWKLGDVCDCVSAVLHAVLTRAATLTALFDANRRTWRSWTRCALVDDRLTCQRQRPRPWQIGVGIGLEDGAVVELEQNGAGGPNYRQ